MTLDKDSISSIVGEENAEFLEMAFKQPTEFVFINKYLKNLKKQITVAVNYDKVLDNEITLDEYEETFKSDIVVNAKYQGFFVKGTIKEDDFYKMLCFVNCNTIPKVDNVNNGLVFYNDNFRVFVNDLQSNDKNIAILFKLDNPDNIESIVNVYFNVQEIVKMNDEDVIKLSYDLTDLDYKAEYYDYNSGANLFEIQDALLKTYSVNPADLLMTLGLLYRLKNLGWDKQYIDFIASKNRGFNVLNSNINISLNNVYVNELLNIGYVDEDYSITESGRSALLLLNYATPINTNNNGNFYVTISELVSSQKLKKADLVYVSAKNTSFFGIKNEFFVDQKCLFGMNEKQFTLDTDYAIAASNSFDDDLVAARAIGYSSNIKISNNETLEFEICNQLYNTLNDDTINVLGGLVSIQPYNSNEVIYINSLFYSLIKVCHNNIYPFVSKTNSSYVFFKNNDDKIVGFIKTKKFICDRENIGTQDLSILFNKINQNYSGKLLKGLNITEHKPLVVGVGFVEKAELTMEDYNTLLNVPFSELNSVLNTLNKDVYFSELNVKDIIEKIISQKAEDYTKYQESVKAEMNNKLLALELLQDYYTSVGEDNKINYYFGVIESYKEKITNFIL